MKNIIKKLKNNKKFLTKVAFIFFALVLILSIKDFLYGEHLKNDATVIFPQGEVQVQLAETSSARELGLSYRKTIFDKEGMFFVFDEPGNYSFWMKDMNFPIDILWISSDKRIVYVEENVATSTYPKSFTNNSKAMYVLEIKANTRKELGAFLGTEVKIKD